MPELQDALELLELTVEINELISRMRRDGLDAAEKIRYFIDWASAACAADPGADWAPQMRNAIEKARQALSLLERSIGGVFHPAPPPRSPERELSGLSIRECGQAFTKPTG